jgi:hypothetical protein
MGHGASQVREVRTTQVHQTYNLNNKCARGQPAHVIICTAQAKRRDWKVQNVLLSWRWGKFCNELIVVLSSPYSRFCGVHHAQLQRAGATAHKKWNACGVRE